jgi:hypothetical protein
MMECAVWYYRYHVLEYELCADEDEAVRFASGMSDAGTGAVIGVQFADGRTIKEGDWSALRAYEEEQWRRYEERARAAAANPPPKRTTRTITDPFDERKIIIDAAEPDWLGRPKVSR